MSRAPAASYIRVVYFYHSRLEKRSVRANVQTSEDLP